MTATFDDDDDDDNDGQCTGVNENFTTSILLTLADYFFLSDYYCYLITVRR